jgi:hypothetical protein
MKWTWQRQGKMGLEIFFNYTTKKGFWVVVNKNDKSNLWKWISHCRIGVLGRRKEVRSSNGCGIHGFLGKF